MDYPQNCKLQSTLQITNPDQQNLTFNLQEMKYPFVFTIITSFFLSSAGLAQKADLRYTITRKDSTALLITVAFSGNTSGSSVLHLPNEWASQKNLSYAVADLKVRSANTTLTPTDKPGTYTVRYRQGALVVFSYLLRKDWTGALRYPLYFRLVIQHDLFYFEGYSGLVYPELPDTARVRCRLTYQGFNKNDFVGNSFYANKTDGEVTVSLSNLLKSKPLAHLLFGDPIHRTDTLKIEKMSDLGFDYQASKREGKIQGLEAASNAAKAGLAENMPLTDQCSIWSNNTEKPAKVGVVKDGKEVLINYMPVAQVDRQTPQFTVSPLYRDR